MPITTLDPRTALVVIDLQTGVLAFPSAHPVDPVVQNAGALAAAFRAHGLPVVLVGVDATSPGRTDQNPGGAAQQMPAEMTGFLDALDQQPGDHVVIKQNWGAFTGTGLDAHLKQLGVTQVVLAGVATSAGVESTARHAREHGFHVTLALDAMTDSSLEAHENSVTRIFPRLAETGTTEEIVTQLASQRSR